MTPSAPTLTTTALCRICRSAPAVDGSHTCANSTCHAGYADRARSYRNQHPDFITPVPAQVVTRLREFHAERAAAEIAQAEGRRKLRGWRIGIPVAVPDEPVRLFRPLGDEARVTLAYVVTCTCGTKLNTGENICSRCRKDYTPPLSRLMAALKEFGE